MFALGGDIYQDIPSQFPQEFPVAHTQPFDYVIPSHKVDVVPGTLLARLTGCESLQVNSMHHQACRRLAPGLILTNANFSTQHSNGVTFYILEAYQILDLGSEQAA